MNKRVENKTKQQQIQLQPNLPADAVNFDQQVGTTRADMISNLPNDILCHIISLLPLESAASTRLISAQWSTLWRTNTILTKHGILEDAAKELTNFLRKVNWVHPLRSPWKLEFHSNQESVLTAATGAKSKLHLNFSSRLALDQDSRFFLDLELNSRYELIHHPANSSFLIKSLYLASINCHFSDTVSSLVSSLNFLERLEIKGCDSLFCLRIHGGTKLEHLTISDCPQLGSLSVLAHGLKSFKYKGQFPDTCVMGISDCKQMVLDFRQGPGYEDFRRLSSHSLLLLYLKDAHDITLCQWTFEVSLLVFFALFMFACILRSKTLDFKTIEFFNCKCYCWIKAMIKPRICSKEKILRFGELKELRWIDSSVEEDKIESLISFLMICPSLERLCITIDPTSYSLPKSRNKSVQAPRIGKPLHHLKMVKMKGFKNKEEEILVAKRILVIAMNQ